MFVGASVSNAQLQICFYLKMRIFFPQPGLVQGEVQQENGTKNIGPIILVEPVSKRENTKLVQRLQCNHMSPCHRDL